MNILKAIIYIFLFLTTSIFSQILEIHQVGVGHGDCSLIVAKDSLGNIRTALIDAGDIGKGGKIVWPHVKEVLGTTFKYWKIDFLILSHLHRDHIGGIPEFLDSANHNSLPIGYFIDRSADSVLQPDSLMNIPDYDDDAVGEPSSQIYTSYASKMTYFIDSLGSNRYAPSLGVNLFEELAGIGMWCVVGNGYVTNSTNTAVIDVTGSKPKSENDVSYGFIIQFGKFKYFTGGDLSGESSGSYIDIETPLSVSGLALNILSQSTTPHVCASKVTHHGSAHSSNDNFLTVFNPTFAVIPAALKSFSGSTLPTKTVIDRLRTHNSVLISTYKTKNGEFYGQPDNLNNLGDVLIQVQNPKPESGTKYLNFNILLRQRSADSPYNLLSGWVSTTVTCKKTH